MKDHSISDLHMKPINAPQGPYRPVSSEPITAKEAGILRTRRVRAYPSGNLPEMIARVNTLRDLKETCKAIAVVNAAGTISKRALRRAQAAIDVKRTELEERVVVAPEDVKDVAAARKRGRRTRGGLYLP